MRRAGFLTTLAALGLFASQTAQAAGDAHPIPSQEWSHSGLFGTFDQAQLQRGFTVYQNVCAGCHSLRLVAYRNLAAIGLTEDEIKAVAAEQEVDGEPDEDGEPTTRPAIPADRFVPPFPNEQAARAANGGSMPPDLSLMTKARIGGPDYLYALLVGYQDEAPEGVEMGEGMSYNIYYPGNQIAMAAPLAEGAVDYADGTEASVEQMAKDVTAFLSWAAEPELEDRKRMGVKVLLFLIVLTGLFYAVKKKVWADVH
ncbi:MAG: cytochrome c1 [Alphaproteobacteria bacterium]|nr:cytochrome c1 [Alphaproteobacteria bacterium]